MREDQPRNQPRNRPGNQPGNQPAAEPMTALFDDLEQQAEGLALAERDAEVAERSRAEYAAVDLASRLHASAGLQVRLEVAGLGRLDATVRRVGTDWCLLTDGTAEWAVRLDAVVGARGLSERAVVERARPVTARLGLGSFLRAVAEDGDPLLLRRCDGMTTRGRVRRVGADFVELSEEGVVEVLAFGHLAALRRL